MQGFCLSIPADVLIALEPEELGWGQNCFSFTEGARLIGFKTMGCLFPTA